MTVYAYIVRKKDNLNVTWMFVYIDQINTLKY